VGAYSFALLATGLDVSFWVALPFAGLMAASAGVLLGFPVLRLRGDYLAIVTLGFGEMIRIILLNWYEFTNGPDGISGIPRPSFFGLALFKRNVAEGNAFHEMFGLEFTPMHRIIFSSRCASASCRSGAPGRRCARTRPPAARSASTRATPS
jgi:branched-chain amino acid transport system permease protein